MDVRFLIKRRPVTIVQNASLRSAAQLLTDEDVSALVVLGDDEVVGMVSERDIVQAIAEGRDMDAQVTAVMVPAPIAAEPDTPVAQVARSMRANWIRHVPVLDSDGELLGVVSARDMLGIYLSDPKSEAAEAWLSTVGPLLIENKQTVRSD